MGDRHIIVAGSAVLRRYHVGRIRENPLADTERGEWTNTMLFYALVFTLALIFAFLYLPSLYF